MVVAFFYVRSSLAKPLKLMVSQVQELEITKTLDLRRDEIGQIANVLIRSPIGSLKLLPKLEIEPQTSVVRHKSWRRECGFATRTEEQSSSLYETASAMEEMTSNVQQNAECKSCQSHSQNMREVVEERKSPFKHF